MICKRENRKIAADILVENHRSVALLTPMTPRPTNGSKSMSISSRGSGWAVPSPANHAAWTKSLTGCEMTAWSSNRCRSVRTAHLPSNDLPTKRTGEQQCPPKNRFGARSPSRSSRHWKRAVCRRGVSPGSGPPIRDDLPTSSAPSPIVASIPLSLSLHQHRHGFRSRWYGTFQSVARHGRQDHAASQ